jgi:hypothetical protein
VRTDAVRGRAALYLAQRRWRALYMKFQIFGGPRHISLMPYPKWDSDFDEAGVWVHAEDADLLFWYFKQHFAT